MTTESTSTETTQTNGHTPRRARSTRPAESLAYVPGQLKTLRKAALTRHAVLKKEIAELEEELGIGEVRESTSTMFTLPSSPNFPGVEVQVAAPKPPAKARARKPAPAAEATPRAPRGSRIEAAKLAVEDIVGKLRSTGKALSSEELQKLTGIDSAVIGLALKGGVKDGTFSVVGVKRAARYSLMADAAEEVDGDAEEAS